jgi:hypothetical protein
MHERSLYPVPLPFARGRPDTKDLLPPFQRLQDRANPDPNGATGQCQEHTRACSDEDRTNTPAPLNGSTIFAEFDFVPQRLCASEALNSSSPASGSPHYTATIASSGETHYSNLTGNADPNPTHSPPGRPAEGTRTDQSSLPHPRFRPPSPFRCEWRQHFMCGLEILQSHTPKGSLRGGIW